MKAWRNAELVELNIMETANGHKDGYIEFSYNGHGYNNDKFDGNDSNNDGNAWDTSKNESNTTDNFSS